MWNKMCGHILDSNIITKMFPELSCENYIYLKAQKQYKNNKWNLTNTIVCFYVSFSYRLTYMRKTSHLYNYFYNTSSKYLNLI